MATKYDGLITKTTLEQQKVEEMVCTERGKWASAELEPQLLRAKHVNYVMKCLDALPGSCMGMDASRSWFCYWGLHCLNILGHKPEKSVISKIIKFIAACRTKEGGYAGGPGQLAHLATTYASVMTLISIGSEEALSSIDREGLWTFLNAMRQPNGSFSVHQGGETDVRAAYCALAVAHICWLPRLDELFEGVASWLIRCQTYEGGFGGEPNCEAHGGYTFCALAGLALLQKTHLVNTETLLKWLANRQMTCEGGFQGRTNKLVDGCYSYWQAACFSAVECCADINKDNGNRNNWQLFDTDALRAYVLEACQNPAGGLRDKPDKNPDLYHTCYTLSGLSICHLHDGRKDEEAIADVHPIYNITMDAYKRATRYFDNQE